MVMFCTVMFWLTIVTGAAETPLSILLLLLLPLLEGTFSSLMYLRLLGLFTLAYPVVVCSFMEVCSSYSALIVLKAGVGAAISSSI